MLFFLPQLSRCCHLFFFFAFVRGKDVGVVAEQFIYNSHGRVWKNLQQAAECDTTGLLPLVLMLENTGVV